MLSLKKDLQFATEQDNILSKQKELLLQDYAVQENEYKVQQQLAKEKVITPLELEQHKSKMIAKANAKV